MRRKTRIGIGGKRGNPYWPLQKLSYNMLDDGYEVTVKRGSCLSESSIVSRALLCSSWNYVRSNLSNKLASIFCVTASRCQCSPTCKINGISTAEEQATQDVLFSI